MATTVVGTYNNVGTTNKPYISYVSLLDSREFFTGIIDQYSDSDFLDFMTSSDSGAIFSPAKDQSIVPSYNSFQSDPLYTVISLAGSNVSGKQSGTSLGTAGSPVTLASTYANLLVIGSTLMAPGGDMWRVNYVSGADFAATWVGNSLTTTTAPVTTLTTAMKLSVYTNSQVEGADGSNPLRWSVSSLTNYIQLFDKSIKLTDVQLMSQVEVVVNGKPYMLPYEVIRGLTQHRGDISLAMWLNGLPTTPSQFSAGDPDGTLKYQYTRGMDSYISTYGVNRNLNTTNTVTLADIKGLTSSLTTQRAPLQYFAMGNRDVIANYSDFFKNLPSSSASQPAGGGLSSSRIMVNGREIDMDVETFKYSGYTFHFKPLGVLSNDQVINFVNNTDTGAKMSAATSLYFLPNAMTAVYGQGSVPYFRYRYMTPPAGVGGQSNAAKTVGIDTVEIMTGGLAPNPTNDSKYLKVNWSSRMGLEVFSPNKFAKLDSVSA